MSNSERANQWHSHINQWKESGLSGTKFFKWSELDLAQFYYWKNKHLTYTRNIAVDKKRPTVDIPQVFLCRDAVDFRKQSNSLAAIVELELGHNPFDGGL